jgi:CheY-like chemotaxis protein
MAADQSHSSAPPSEICVLVVEDEADAREAIVELLEHEGYTAWGVENGARALDLLEHGPRVSLILLDLRMPVMDGWAFCEALAADERFADTPVAIVTANATHAPLPARAYDAGFFVKPIQIDRLLRLAATMCG